MKKTAIVVTLAFLAFSSSVSAFSGPPALGFLTLDEVKNTSWAQPMPSATSPTAVGDTAVYLGTRSLQGTKRWDDAGFDDVYDPEQVAPRFADALGVQLTPQNADLIFSTIHLAQLDLENMMRPVKIKPVDGGRIRPYVQYPLLPACDHTRSDTDFKMNESGSYPSTHAALGMLWALILSRLAPEKSEALFARGYEFGESRLICGFHYPSDLAQGRLAANTLFAKLEADDDFQKAMVGAKAQMDGLTGHATQRSKRQLRAAQKTLSLRAIPALETAH